MLTFFAGPIFTEWYWAPFFVLLAFTPIVLTITFITVLTYVGFQCIRKKKIVPQKVIKLSVAAFIIAIPLSISIQMYRAEIDDAAKFSSEKGYLEREHRLYSEEQPRSYRHDFVTINSSCKNTEEKAEVLMSPFAWSLDVLPREGDQSITVFQVRNRMGPLVLCPGVAITKDGNTADITLLSYNTKLQIDYKRMKTGVYYEYIATAVEIIE